MNHAFPIWKGYTRALLGADKTPHATIGTIKVENSRALFLKNKKNSKMKKMRNWERARREKSEKRKDLGGKLGFLAQKCGKPAFYINLKFSIFTNTACCNCFQKLQ